MAFTPLFEEVAESEFVENIMVVVNRDVKDALDHWYLSDNLPAFAAMTESDQDEFRYPLLVLAIESGTSEESVSGEYLNQEVVVGAGLVVDGLSVKDVRQKAKKYVRALKAVLRNSVLELLPQGSQYTDYSISFSHRYFKHGTKGTVFTQPVEMRIKFTLGET
jgi:hypothetical protein